MQALEKGLDLTARGIVRLCEWLTMAMGGWLAVTLVASVFFRFVLNSSLTWVDESSALLLVCLMLAVAPIGFHEYIHISVDVLVERLPRSMRLALGIFINACSFLLFSVTGYFGFFMVINDFHTEMASIPMVQGWFTMFLPVACVFVLFVCANNVVKILRLGDLPTRGEKML